MLSHESCATDNVEASRSRFNLGEHQRDGVRNMSDATMSKAPLVTLSSPEKDVGVGGSLAPAASTSNAARSPASASSPNPKPKPRSCVTCRTRKVRCDKESPCSNCRRANIPCVVPSEDRPPRWARRLGRNGINVPGTVAPSNVTIPPEALKRILYLENLVKDLSAQLEKANAGTSSGVGSPASSSHDHGIEHQEENSSSSAGGVQKAFGRLVLQDANKSRYVSSGFWSRLNDQMDGFDSDTSDEEITNNTTTPSQEAQRTPSERHSFLFGHSLGSPNPDLRDLHPLPSQIPFLLDVFYENVNSVFRVVHAPTISKMVRDSRGGTGMPLTPANEALMFSIYYSAITSMDEDDVITNFGLTKASLNLKYRIGLEQALAKADFLNVPDLTLVQAFIIFLGLVRRHDSPRFVWMMTGLVIRMGQALGLQRDASHFPHMTPFEMEMRRRCWWVLISLDMRSAEDQGTDLTIQRSAFDTKLPLNINDEDISPQTTEMPTPREGVTDMTFVLIMSDISEISRKLVERSSKGGPDLEEQSKLVSGIYDKVDQGYLRHTIAEGNILSWMLIIIARLVMAKMTLLTFTQFLFSSSTEQFSDAIKDKLLVAAIEIAEYNHALNAEHKARQWRWVFQTYTHWYAVVYMLMEVTRRPWSPIVERAWVALHSEWLIPSESHMDKNLRFWVPLKKMTTKARKHRDAELDRLRRDPRAVEWLEMEDMKIPVPGSPGTSVADFEAAEMNRRRWRELVTASVETGGYQQMPVQTTAQTSYTTPSSNQIMMPTYNDNNTGVESTFDPAYNINHVSPNQHISGLQQQQFQTPPTYDTSTEWIPTQPYNAVSAIPAGWGTGPNLDHWLWADSEPGRDVFSGVNIDDIDMNMDLDLEGDVDWYKWVDVAKGM